MSTKSSVDLRAELAELVKRKAEIAVSSDNNIEKFTISLKLKIIHYNFIFLFAYLRPFSLQFPKVVI